MQYSQGFISAALMGGVIKELQKEAAALEEDRLFLLASFPYKA